MASLIEFNKEFLSNDNVPKFQQIVFLETNDSYSRGMGILAKKEYQIQSQEITQVYKNLKNNNNLIAVIGTLNAPSYGDSISSLLKSVDLKDISKHTTFDTSSDKSKNLNFSRMDAMGVNIKQRGYLLLSPNFFKTIKNSGWYRKGIWQKKQPQWNMYKSIQKEIHAASEHPLIWSEFD